MNTRLIALFLCFWTLFGCASEIRLVNYRSLDIDKKIYEIKPPKYIMEKKMPRVAVLPIADNSEFKGALSQPVTETVLHSLSGIGLDLVERSQMDKLFNEAKFRASLGESIDFSMFSNLVKEIDYVVIGSITHVKTWTSASRMRDGSRTFPVCTQKARAILNLRIIFPETGSIHKAFESFNGQSAELMYNDCSRVKDSKQAAIKAVLNALENTRYDFMEAFPRYGYVFKTMSNPDNPKDRIAHISLGRKDGLKAGDKLILSRYVKTRDEVKNSDTLSFQDITELDVNESGLSDGECILKIPEGWSKEVMSGYVVKTKFDPSLRKKSIFDLRLFKRSMPEILY